MDDKSQGFKQPPGKSSKLEAFILMIKFFHIQAEAVRAIVSALPYRTTKS